MTWPEVNVSQVNLYNGTTNEVERVVLFVGYGKENVGKTQPLNTGTDLNKALGDEDSVLKSIVSAARDNAGQNWFAYVHVIAEPEDTGNDTSWIGAVYDAQNVASVEGVVLVSAPSNKTTIEFASSTRANLQASYGRFVWMMVAVDGPAAEESWLDYIERLTALQKGIAASGVQLVPRIWGNEPGVLAGRLCNRSVTVADSPARVATGALLSLGNAELPVDGTGTALELATLQTLQAARYSVPMWYPDYDGYYWSDGRTLDVEGGDYQSIETIRIMDKAARRVRLLAISKIADRSLNSTPGSIAAHQTLFARPLREMSTAANINGVSFPGEVKPPQDGDITIVWKNKKAVDIYIVVRTYEVPLQISISLLLDASLETNS